MHSRPKLADKARYNSLYSYKLYSYRENNVIYLVADRTNIVFSFKCFGTCYIKTQNPVLCRQKGFVFSLGLFK